MGAAGGGWKCERTKQHLIDEDGGWKCERTKQHLIDEMRNK
jgi:hypothetical protein